jgi:nucleoside-diphosphate-sugar epimerase
VVRALVAQGCEVIALVRPSGSHTRLAELGAQVGIVEGDFHIPTEWEDQLGTPRPTGLVHLAWHAEPGNYRNHPGNLADLTASLRLFERANAWGCARFVGVGTCLEYATDRGYLSEDVPLAPHCLYESAKASLYLSASAWARTTGASFAWVRLFYQHGPGENPRRLVPSVVNALLANRPVALTAGWQVRDYLHVDDVAAAIAQLTISDATGPFNVGSGRPVRVRDVVDELESQIGRAGLIQYGELADARDDPAFICANTGRLRAATGWQPRRTLEAGLADTIAWWAAMSKETQA